MTTNRRTTSSWGRACAAAALLATALLGGCGGGSSNPLTVHAQQSALDMTFVPGYMPGRTGQVTFSYSGDVPKQVYIYAQSDNPAVNSVMPVYGNGVMAANVFVSTVYQAGDYTGHLDVQVCLDAACTQQAVGSPMRIPVTVHVVDFIKTSPSGAVVVQGVSGQPMTRSVGVQFYAGTPPYSVFPAYPARDIITIGDVRADSFDVNFAGNVPSGTYSQEILLQAAGGTTLDVTYQVAAPPGGEHNLEVGTLRTLTVASGSTVETDLAVSAPTWNPPLVVDAETYPSTVGSPCSWLTLAPEATGYHLLVDATNLRPGTYDCWIGISAHDLYTIGQVAQLIVNVTP